MDVIEVVARRRNLWRAGQSWCVKSAGEREGEGEEGREREREGEREGGRGAGGFEK